MPPSAAQRVARVNARDSVYRRILATADAAAAIVALVVGGVLVSGADLAAASLAVPLLLIGLAKLAGLYDRDSNVIHKTTLDEVPVVFRTTTLAVLALWLGDEAVADEPLTTAGIAVAWATLFGAMLGFRWLGRSFARRVTAPERCLLVGDRRHESEVEATLALSDSGARLIGSLGVPPHEPGTLGALRQTLEKAVEEHDPDRVMLAPSIGSPDEVMFAIQELKLQGVKVSVLSDHSWVLGSSIEFDRIGGLTLLGMRRFEFNRSSAVIKRSFDVFASGTILLAATPVLAAIALATKLDSPGPVLFRQRRVGRDGNEFMMLKFRSMIDGAESMRDELAHLDEGAEGLFKINSDPRVTRVGKLIRQLSLDELPQLLNVLRGDMSLVGPRPLVPEEDALIRGPFRDRLSVPPGITGHWQVLGASRIPIGDMVKLDYLYVANWSLWGDIVLLLRTVPVVLGRRGV